MFVASAFDGFLPVPGKSHFLLVMNKVGVPTELHINDAGGQGYGLPVREVCR